MITFDAFYEQYRQDVRDLNAKIDKNHDEIQPKIDELCKRVTVIETERDAKVKAHDKTLRGMKSVIGIMGGVFSVVQALHIFKIV